MVILIYLSVRRETERQKADKRETKGDQSETEKGDKRDTEGRQKKDRRETEGRVSAEKVLIPVRVMQLFI